MVPSKEMKEAIGKNKTQILMTLSQRQNSLDASMERVRRTVGSSNLPGLTGTPTETLHGAINDYGKNRLTPKLHSEKWEKPQTRTWQSFWEKCALSIRTIFNNWSRNSWQTHAKPPPKWMHQMKKNMKRTSIREHGGCTSTAKVKKEKQADDFGSSLDVINLVSDNEETINVTQVNGGTEIIEESLSLKQLKHSVPLQLQLSKTTLLNEVAAEEGVAQNEDPQ